MWSKLGGTKDLHILIPEYQANAQPNSQGSLLPAPRSGVGENPGNEVGKRTLRFSSHPDVDVVMKAE